MKLVIIGFDALDPALFRTRAPEGYTVLPLYSEVPVTGPAWWSIYTGQTLEHHGVRDVWGMGDLPDINPSRTYADCPKVKPPALLWDALNDAGLKCGLFGLPACHPPRPLDGWHVAGCGASPEELWWPATLCEGRSWDDMYGRLDLIHRYGGEYPEFRKWPKAFRRHLFREGLLTAITDAKACCFAAIASHNSRPVDVLFICFTFVSRFLHEQAWDWGVGEDKEPKDFVYRAVRNVTELLERELEPEATLIVSAHGGDKRLDTNTGVFAYRGKGFESVAAGAGTPSVLDVAPTVCALLGAELPKADGRPTWT